MKTKLLTGLLVANATLLGFLAEAATAFSWDHSWIQPTILGKSQTQFDDTPFQPFIQNERIELANSGQFLLDPSQLKLKYDHDVSVYFINEGAASRNQLAFTATRTTAQGTTTQSGLVFGDLASSQSVVAESDGPLSLGDGVKLGRMGRNTQLDFWLRANGQNIQPDAGWDANLYGTRTAANPDGLQHVVAYVYNNHLILGFEDLYGEKNAEGIDIATGKTNERSDRDFNDVVVVVDIGERNARELVKPKTTAEPSSVLALLGLGGVASVIGLRYRQAEVKG